MRKTFLKVSLLAVLGLGMSASFTSCKDYDSELDNIQSQLDQLKSKVTEIENLVKGGSVITGVTQAADGGVTFTMSDGKTVTIPAGKNGKDADVWTIVKNAEGAYYWAKNGEITEFPAQGPAGENGVAEPGICYVPNEDGFFYEYNPATGESKKTGIEWRSKGGNLSAVATEDKVILTGVVDADGKPADDITIWRSMFVKSLVVKPELYLDGIEATRYAVIEDAQVIETKTTTAATEVSDVPYGVATATDKTTANVLAGQPWQYANLKSGNNLVTWTAGQKAELAYHLNPDNAAISGMGWNLIFDDIEVVNRASGVSGTVSEVSAADENGDITIKYQLEGVKKLAPYTSKNNKGEEVGPVNDWTFMALQAINPQNDSNLVTSDNVAILKEVVNLNHIVVTQETGSAADYVYSADNATIALQEVKDTHSAENTIVLNAAYNAVYDLASHLGINVTSYVPMIDGADGKGNLQNSAVTPVADDTYVVSLATAEKMFGLKATYTLVEYTVNPNKTSESQFAKIADAQEGKITPYYLTPNQTWQPVPSTGLEGRSAIGRRPLVYVTIANEKNEIILAGFVKIKWVEKAAQNVSTILNNEVAKVPYICEYKVNSTWEQISGKIYEELQMTPEEFFKDFELVGATGDAANTSSLVFVKDGDEFIQTTGNPDIVNGLANYGTWSWDTYTAGAHTQKLVFTVTPENYKSWYAKKEANDSWSQKVTKESKSQVLYAQFKSKSINKVVYMGFDITLVGAPAADFVQKIASQWSTDMAVAPINPAVPGQTTDKTPVQVATGYVFASAMSMNFQSVWEAGQPKFTGADPVYNFNGKKDSPYLLKENKAQYRFAAAQNNVTGVSGTEYKIGTLKKYTVGGPEGPAKVDAQALYAAAINPETGKADEAKAQPIAAITLSGDANFAARGVTGYDNNINNMSETNNWEVISMLPYYNISDWSGAVVTPSNKSAGTTEWTIAEYACDIVNSKTFNKNAPEITFNVEMVVTYGQVNNEDGEVPDPAYTCELVIPDVYPLMVGVGRPLTLNTPETPEPLQDAVDGAVKVAKLFSMVDWQGHLLWNTSRTGAVTANKFNGTDLFQFWFSQGTYAVQQWPNADKAGITVDVAGAKLTDDRLFNDVYVDKKLTLVANNVEVEKNVKTISKIEDFENLVVTWTNNGSAVTSDIVVMVPVYVTYVWGEKILVGYANITIQPTLSE